MVSISRSSFYYRGKGESPLNLNLMRLIDAQFLETPWYGSRQMARHLRRLGYTVGRKRVRRLMRLMGLQAIYQAPRTSDPHPDHRIYPYLLRGLVIDRPPRSKRISTTGLRASDGLTETTRPISPVDSWIQEPGGKSEAILRNDFTQSLSRSPAST
ncbi:MAG: transposase [Proteobacteria bacterium]|nr:transposase [Pseudomonadota bacterium]